MPTTRSKTCDQSQHTPQGHNPRSNCRLPYFFSGCHQLVHKKWQSTCEHRPQRRSAKRHNSVVTDSSMSLVALDIFMEGRVQGVGFRPFVLSVARSLSICGWVCNTPQGVAVHAEATLQELENFVDQITYKLPAPAQIHSIRKQPSDFQELADFVIQASRSEGEHLGAITPDLCLCEDCKREMLDPKNRRYRHPFISCTRCGPRFSIIQSLPYDRPQTSMQSFPMCSQCLAEYENSEDRRFHAQPICCPNCGPHMWCETLSQEGLWLKPKKWFDKWITHTSVGGISLVKGIGGFHLLCDALNIDALQRLRTRKQRDSKPFAIMVPSLEAARKFCTIRPAEEALLLSVERPIVILDVHTPPPTMPWLAPGLTQLGIMLPYSPLHELFFSQFENPVVLTSANRAGEPMLTSNKEAREFSGLWCDLLVLHDRDIVNRADDGVSLVAPNSMQSISLRIGRGASPHEFSWPSIHTGLAFGADLKNTVALAHHGRITLSQHIGDMESPLSQELSEQIAERLCSSYQIIPEYIACDAHPDYFSSQLAQRVARQKKLPIVYIQHHHAHIAATWLEHRWQGNALGFAMDGTGFGDPDCIWGSEVMLYTGDTCETIAHMQSLRLPGGDLAVREPARLLISALHDFANPANKNAWFNQNKQHSTIYSNGLRDMLNSNLNCPSSRGLGRLFDLVGAMLHMQNPHWDGEFGARLEALDTHQNAPPWTVELDKQQQQIILAPLINDALNDVLRGSTPSWVASRLHATVCDCLIKLGEYAETILERSSDNNLAWVFAGGVFQNQKIISRLQAQPQIRTRNCYFSSIPNDNGIALGQIVVASHLLAKGYTLCA